MIYTIDKVSKAFGGQVLFHQASLRINPQDRIALVGANGTGKTTLLNMIIGKEFPDEGELFALKGVKIGYLEQEAIEMKGASVLEELISSAHEVQELRARIQELEASLAQLEHGRGDSAQLREYARLQERFEFLGGWDLEYKAASILTGLGFKEEDFTRRVEEYSGGWQMRIALAKLLLKQPDLLLLDEPTNHLDLESVRWLESFLSSYPGAILLVSHDRAFMDNLVEHVASLEHARIKLYHGNYSSFLKQREEALEQLKLAKEAQDKELAHLQDFVDRFRYKATKARQAQERLKRIEKIQEQRIVLPEARPQFNFRFNKPPRTSDKVIELCEVSKSYGNKLVYDGINFTCYRGEKIALVGPNGAGKSTLLKLLAGVIEPSRGKRVLGTQVSIGYYAQHQLEKLDPQLTVAQEFDRAASQWASYEQIALLGSFMFKGDDLAKKISVLSGGEKARLALAKMLVQPAPLLCLDEPTNHLDIATVDILEHALRQFEGSLVLITHDRHLIQAVAHKIVEVKEGKIRVFEGDYEYYLWKSAELDRAGEEAGATAYKLMDMRPKHEEVQQASAASLKSGVSGYKTKEQRRKEAELRNAINRRLSEPRKKLQKIEEELDAARLRYQELIDAMASEALYADKEAFDAAMREYTELKPRIVELEEAWLVASEQLEELSCAVQAEFQ